MSSIGGPCPSTTVVWNLLFGNPNHVFVVSSTDSSRLPWLSVVRFWGWGFGFLEILFTILKILWVLFTSYVTWSGVRFRFTCFWGGSACFFDYGNTDMYAFITLYRAGSTQACTRLKFVYRLSQCQQHDIPIWMWPVMDVWYDIGPRSLYKRWTIFNHSHSDWCQTGWSNGELLSHVKSRTESEYRS